MRKNWIEIDTIMEVLDGDGVKRKARVRKISETHGMLGMLTLDMGGKPAYAVYNVEELKK